MAFCHIQKRTKNNAEGFFSPSVIKKYWLPSRLALAKVERVKDFGTTMPTAGRWRASSVAPSLWQEAVAKLSCFPFLLGLNCQHQSYYCLPLLLTRWSFNTLSTPACHVTCHFMAAQDKMTWCVEETEIFLHLITEENSYLWILFIFYENYAIMPDGASQELQLRSKTFFHRNTVLKLSKYQITLIKYVSNIENSKRKNSHWIG